MCLPYLKFSDLLPETHFFFIWPESKWAECVYYLQATIGKCNTPKPGMMDLVGKYKWNAWNDLGNMSQVLVHFSNFLVFLKSGPGAC